MRVGQTAKCCCSPNHSITQHKLLVDERNRTVTSSPAFFPAERLVHTERMCMATRYVDGLIAFAYFATVFFGTMYVKGPKLFKRRGK